MSNNKIQLFENSKVRTHWDANAEKWYLSIVDVIAILTDSKRPRKYWSDLKTKLKKEGSELSENIGQLKMLASDGKIRKTDVADTELILNMLAEASTKDISEAKQPKNFNQSKTIAKQGGNVAKVAGKELEKRTGKKVISPLNANTFLQVKNTKKLKGDEDGK